MKFRKIIEDNLKTTSLKRIRVKVDPAKINTEKDFSKIEGYEGYVLEESKGNLKILVLNPELTIDDIPEDVIEYINDEDKEDTFNELRAFIIRKLNLKENDPLINQLTNTSCISDIEVFLKQAGHSDECLSSLYKAFIIDDTPVNEGIFKKVIGGTAKLAKKAINAPERIVGAAKNVVIGGDVSSLLDPIISWGTSKQKRRKK